MVRCTGSHRVCLSLLGLAAALVFLACGADEQESEVTASTTPDPDIAAPATEAACPPPRSSPTPRASWGPPSPWSAHTYTYCGTVTIDGQPAPDGSRVRFGVSAHDTSLTPCGDTATLDGGYQVSFLVYWDWQTGCNGYSMYVRAAGRWANEIAYPEQDGLVRRLDLTVTNPPLFFRPDASPSDDARNYSSGPFCDQTGLEISEPRLITMEATKEGYGPVTNKNKVVRPGGRLGGFQLRRGATLVVNDGCAFQGGPPLSAAGGEDAAVCRKFGQGPHWFLSECPVHALRQAHTPEGSLVGITGATIRADTKEPVPGATVSLVEDGLAVTTDERGCFGFSPLLLSSPFRLITLEVAAPGFRPLTMKNVILEGNLGMDVQPEAGSEPLILDQCGFDSSPPAPEDEARFRHCQMAGAQP